MESLCIELIGGRAIGIGTQNVEFRLPTVHSRSVLQWYSRNRGKWAGNLASSDAEAIVDSLQEAPVEAPPVASATAGPVKRLTLMKVVAHRFAGLHQYGLFNSPPEDFVLELKAPLTFFEGMNGSGKTSIINAIVWALTGEVLRPQRAPENALLEFDCELEAVEAGQPSTSHKTVSIVPLPQVALERPKGSFIMPDTWVELTFKDESGNLLPPVKRAAQRATRGATKDIESGLSTLGLDPVSARIGTVMPALLPFIQIGAPSQLGKAVAELTGLAPLVQLAKHASKAKVKISGDFSKEREGDIVAADEAYEVSRKDLVAQVAATPTISFTHILPSPSAAATIEASIKQTIDHFEQLKATGLADAKKVLGDDFDPNDESQSKSLESNIGPAAYALEALKTTASASRLSGLAKISPADLSAAKDQILRILSEAKTLVDLAADDALAARIRLYALIADWMKQHPVVDSSSLTCVVCGGDIKEAKDPVTGKTVLGHLHDAAGDDAALLAQTLTRWGATALGALATELPEALQVELKRDLPEHPCDLVFDAVLVDLLQSQPFQGVLKSLRTPVNEACENARSEFPALGASELQGLAESLPQLPSLQQAVLRLDKAIRFAEWRKTNGESVVAFMTEVVGRAADDNPPAANSLLGRLQLLQSIVEGVEPINNALKLCNRLTVALKKRRGAEVRIEEYKLAVAALTECAKLGELADRQVEQLQTQLHAASLAWRTQIYQGAYPATSHELVSTQMESDGRLDFRIGSNGVSAPAQYVANASALRASLVGFFIAYWQHLLIQRGGLNLLLLDDPQELLDGDNRERLSSALTKLSAQGAQLLVTTHDSKFASLMIRATKAAKIVLDHRSVHPPTLNRPTLLTTASVMAIEEALRKTLKDEDDVKLAQEYASECRLFIEARLGDLFDDAAFPATSSTVPAPTLGDHLNRLRAAVKTPSNELYKSSILNKLSKDPSLADGSAVLALLNKAHHQHKATIQPLEVKTYRGDLERLRKDVERAHEDFRLYLRRDKLQPTELDVPALELDSIPKFELKIHPNLAAFVMGSTVGESQETDLEVLSSSWFESKAFYFLRTQNFGFASTVQSTAIVEAMPSVVEDRNLVIARRGDAIYARRLLRPSDSAFVALASETPDPRNSRATLLFPEGEVALHRVVGMLFHTYPNVGKATQEAVKVDGVGQLKKITSAFRIKEQSAVPLALPGQIALGGPTLKAEDFDTHLEAYVALDLSDGSSIFKRIGPKLPSPLSHLRQFETIGGLGAADILAVGKMEPGFKLIVRAVLVLGVLYHS